MSPTLVAPFPWFGGKSREASTVWDALGTIQNYVEPFAGSLAVLLGAPEPCKVETVNDIDGFICNFWRAVAGDPEAVAYHADWPVSEIDLSARHAWLVARAERLRWSLEDPEFYDSKIAGWWVWGICSWIGSGWCSGTGPHKHDGAHFRGDAGMGINRKLPHLGNAGRGINRQLPHLGNAGRGINRQPSSVEDWLARLSERLRCVRVANGDWSRVVTPSVTSHQSGITGVYLDPPYGGATGGGALYSADTPGLAKDVWDWAQAHGDDPKMRIVVSAYEDARLVPAGWTTRKWRARAGYARNGNRSLEILYCSPNCQEEVPCLVP